MQGRWLGREADNCPTSQVFEMMRPAYRPPRTLPIQASLFAFAYADQEIFVETGVRQLRQ
ncbi:hypothetical protein [Pseudomonas sp. UFMG81]|uniref:hypothetical protein n=1 Tax=Pseudomonas sp. UFMG81 TaxID=2745936 RepID=UPI00188E67A4|nr:hypothetical protein [Pseudomonas sp. UFMG81]